MGIKQWLAMWKCCRELRRGLNGRAVTELLRLSADDWVVQQDNVEQPRHHILGEYNHSFEPSCVFP